MAERVISVRTYVIVCTLLVLLTILTVSVSFFKLSGAWHVTLGLIIGTIKASLVGLFFMHLLHSSRVTWIVVTVAVGWMVLLFVLTITDYLSRNLIEYTPGH